MLPCSQIFPLNRLPTAGSQSSFQLVHTAYIKFKFIALIVIMQFLPGQQMFVISIYSRISHQEYYTGHIQCHKA